MNLSKTMNMKAGWLKVIYISPSKKAWPFIWTKIDFLSPKDALRKVSLILAQWFWGSFLNFVNVFSLLGPLWKERVSSFVRKFVWNWTDRHTNRRSKKLIWALSSVELKNWKCTTATPTIDNGQISIIKVYLILRLRWAKNENSRCTPGLNLL